MAYAYLPIVETSTPDQRLQALKDAKDLMSSNGNKGGIMTAFVGENKTAPGASHEVITGMIRLGEYITTGHDYSDTHPFGKARPIVNTHNITVMVPPMTDRDDMEHFLSHVEDGSFMDFLKEQMGADGDTEEGTEDEPEAPESK